MSVSTPNYSPSQQSFNQYYNAYIQQIPNSFMAAIAAEIEVIKKEGEMAFNHYAILKQIKNHINQQYGLEKHFMELGIAPEIALQLTYGAVWLDDEALNNIEVADELVADVNHIITTLSEQTEATIDKISNLTENQSMLLAIGFIYLQVFIETEQKEKVNDSYVLLANKTKLLERTIETPEELSVIDIFSLDHYCACFLETENASYYLEKGEKWLREKYGNKSQSNSQNSETIITPPPLS